MRSVVKKSGNSASVRIPAAVMQAANMALNEAVDVREEAGRIVIEPVRLMEYRLDDLLEQITPENLHAEVEFGRPTGKEAWRRPVLMCLIRVTSCGPVSIRK